MTVECPICFEKFDSFRGLNGHMNRHRPKRKRAESQTMDCPICGQVCIQISAVDFECPDCETLWTKMQGDGFTYLEAEDMPTFVNDEGVETPLTELDVFGEVYQLSCPLCAYRCFERSRVLLVRITPRFLSCYSFWSLHS